MGLELNGTHQLLACAGNMLRDNVHTMNKSTETFIDVSKETGLEINIEKTKYMFLSRHQNAGQNWDIKIANGSVENVYQLKYLGTTVANQHFILEGIKRRPNSGNAYYHSIQNLLSSCLLSKNVKITIYKTIILLVDLNGCETWSLTL
jgi:hypothetical protein